MLHFKHSSIINAPVEVVWKFHERSDILQILTPPWQPVQVVRRDLKVNKAKPREERTGSF
ncbi:cyclase, partial [Dolichospermum sp. ST_sed10]|nr:cyclase [Dolichospermum sp. ST_sed10]